MTKEWSKRDVHLICGRNNRTLQKCNRHHDWQILDLLSNVTYVRSHKHEKVVFLFIIYYTYMNKYMHLVELNLFIH